VAATPAIAAAERAGIRFALHEYEHDPGTTSFGDEAVAKLGIDAARIFKTLVVSVDGELVIACVPVSAQLDLKSLGSAPGSPTRSTRNARRAMSAEARARSAAGGHFPRISTSRRSRTRPSSSTGAAAACSSSSTHETSRGSPMRASTR
jgi:Cys-tRNA(Pro)/Cys-tRNA(Cys) deacylase